jgi:hypothetical protein
MDSATADSTPAWKEKLQKMASYYRTCHEKGDLAKYFEVYRPSAHGDDEEGTGATIRSTLNLASQAKSSDENYDALQNIGDEMIREHEACSQSIEATADELKKSNADKPTAIDRLQKMREEMKRRSCEIIDKKMDETIAWAEALPEEKRDAAVDFWVKIQNKFLEFWTCIWELVDRVLKTVIGWLANVWAAVAKCWEEVKEVFVNVWNWFKALF